LPKKIREQYPTSIFFKEFLKLVCERGKERLREKERLEGFH
jgi:hypothetical protein